MNDKFDEESPWQPGVPDTKTYEGSPDMQPEVYITPIETKKHTHYFVRTAVTEFGCQNCGARWIDGGKFAFNKGKYHKDNF